MLWLFITLVLITFVLCRCSKALHCTSLTSLALISILLHRISTGTSLQYYLSCRIQSSIELKEDLSMTENTRRIPMADR